MRSLAVQEKKKSQSSSYRFKANSASPDVKNHVKGFGGQEGKDSDKKTKKETLLDQLLKLEKEGEELRFTPTQIAEVRKQIAALTSVEEQKKYYLLLHKAVDYKSQRDNESPSSVYELEHYGKTKRPLARDYMCNLTVLAMCLEYLGVENPVGEKKQQFEDYLETKRVELCEEYKKEFDKEHPLIKEVYNEAMLELNQKKQKLA
ncbi:hypothetical protein [Flammeovirga aprica]|uniref:Uncharacterized protein n=1 Tax=Flammeovirga aprica JL-4 TaxID=694437 RepID=A0A7X9P0S1_9BACT|nr:hypothetical protein [Flammeovirga aprica]NME67451.1 hypothetical protein [Flammeovirga aprica JL-4]